MGKTLLVLVLLFFFNKAQEADCETALLQFFNSTIKVLTGETEGPQDGAPLLYSGKGPNDLGQYRPCLRSGNNYYVLHNKIHRISTFVGLCMPKECSAEAIEASLNSLVTQTDEEASITFRVDLPEDPNLGSGGKFALFLIFGFVALAIWGSILDAKYSQAERKPSYFGIVHPFAFTNNFRKLFAKRQSETNEAKTLDCLNGVRVISMSWVILGHCFSFRSHSAIINIEELPDVLGRLWVALCYGGFFAVDSFFWLGGLLMGYLTLMELEKRRGKLGVIGWTFVYLHRLLRILPMYIFMMIIYNWFARRVGSGPLWFETDAMTENCDEYWWSNLLFINNFVPNGKGNGCFGIGWYLANDMQFFWFSPIIIMVYYNFAKWIGWLFKVTLVVAGVVTSTTLASEYGFTANIIDNQNTRSEEANFYFVMYVKPYCRYIPYVLGLYCGFVYLRYTKMKSLQSDSHPDKAAYFFIDKIRNTKFGAITSFALGIAFISFFILIQRQVYSHLNEEVWTPAENALFLGTYRLGYSLGLVMVMMPLLLNRLKLVYNILAAPFWEPFAKLSFACFLIHYAVMITIFSSDEGSIAFTGTNLFCDWVMANALSWTAAVPLSLVIEVPFMTLEKMLCNKLKGSKGKS